MSDATENSPVVTPEAPPQVQPAGAGGDPNEAERLARIQRESDAALLLHNQEQPAKRGAGKRGPDKVKRKPGSGGPRRVPLGTMGDGSGSSLFEENSDTVSSPAWVESEKPFDEQAARAFFDMVLNGWAAFAEILLSGYGHRVVGDDAIVEAHVVKAKPSDDTRRDFVEGWTSVAKKHNWHLNEACYVQAGLGTGTLLMREGKQFNALRKLGKERSEPNLAVVPPAK